MNKDKEQFNQFFTLGYCKMCREWDVLLRQDHTCFDCNKLTLAQVMKKEENSK